MADGPDIHRTPPAALAAGFDAPERGAWLALVERTLKGAPLASLTRHSLEGLAIEPLYAAAAAPALALAEPGWDVRIPVRSADPADANTEALEALEQGGRSLMIVVDPTGKNGVAIGSADDLVRVLDGVLLDAAAVALDAKFLGARAADWLGAAAKGAPAAQLSLHLDPLSALAEAGASPGPIEAHLIACASVGARLADPYPRASLFLASGRVAHEAGAGEAAEVALAAASALAYAKALARAGLSVADAFDRIVLGLSVDADAFLGIAKLRAARRVWARLATACGAAPVARIEARSSARMLTRADPWTNMIRLTAAAFAGAVGGADALALGAFTDALGAPTPFARRQSRNIQLVLSEEANLGRVVDPGAGSGYVEALTDEIARAAWADLQRIEAAGGVIRALEDGLVADIVQSARQELQRRIKAREVKLLGVTDFPAEGGRPPETAAPPSGAASAPDPRLPGPDGRCPQLTPISLEALA